jgi:hypothetical protein
MFTLYIPMFIQYTESSSPWIQTDVHPVRSHMFTPTHTHVHSAHTHIHSVYTLTFTLYIDSYSPSLQTHELLPMFCTAFLLLQRIIRTVDLADSFSCALQYLLLHAVQWILHYHQLCSTALRINNVNMERIAREERDMVISWRKKRRFIRLFPPMEKSTAHSKA